jgi:hypothetical protein
MSSMAKTAREAMKAKAQRLGSSRPLEKVDSSTFVPPELLNADVKTGLRPVSRRAFKKGGKVMGDCNAPRGDRKPRKSGGKAITADSLINRNVKEANEGRDGIKHIGGMKKGGAAKRKGRDEGGKVDEIGEYIKKDDTPYPKPAPKQPSDNTPDVTPAQAERMRKYGTPIKPPTYKKGGKVKKADGGPMSGAQEMMSRAQRTAGVPASTLDSVPASSKFSHSMGLKKGGKVHEDVAEDKALIKKMVKPSARTGKAIGGIMGEMFSPALMLANAVRGKKEGGRTGRATGGQVFSGPSYPGKIPGVVPGGRTARATGGKTKGKGKTNINIVIAAGKTPGADAGVLPPGAMPKPPGGIPIPLGPQGGPPQGAAPMPLPVPMPMPAPAGGPAGGPPMARKAGGRISKVASSYKDMEAGSAGGEGRLQKTDIAKKHKGAPTFKKGGKVYRSYKDMDAGAASGLGRLEKTEIAARKG